MKSLNDLISDLSKKGQAIKVLQERFPAIIGVECVRIIKSNFAKEGYNSPKEWDKRSSATDAAYDYNRTNSFRTKTGRKSKYKNPYKGSVVSSKNKILGQTHNLRDSVSFNVQGKIVQIGVFARTVNINGKTHDALSYAKIHNEGGSTKWGKHSVTIPKRKFIPTPSEGPNQEMLNAAQKKFDSELNKILSEWKK